MPLLKHAASWCLLCLLGFASAFASTPRTGSPEPPPPPGAAVPSKPRPAAPPGAAVSWSESMVADLLRSEYEFSRLEDGGLSAPNREQGFRSRIDGRGLSVVPRRQGSGNLSARDWSLRLTTRAWGRAPELLALPEGTPANLARRLTVARRGISEWFVNEERGLEHGFTIEAPPEALPRDSADATSKGERAPDGVPGTESSPEAWSRQSRSTEKPARDDAAPLVIEIGLEGLQGALGEGARSILLTAADGEAVLRYGALEASDARGAALPARLELGDGFIRILVDDTAASYPLTIDPLLASPVWTAESNQASAQFATSVATAGDVNGDGYSDVIVGAPFYDNGQTDEGRAYVFLGSPSGPAASAAWTAESNQASAQFGGSVAAAGDVNGDGYGDVIVGARLYDNGQTDEGRVFVYLGSASGLAASAAWTAESNQASADFGKSVAPAGDVNGDGYADVIVGADLYDNGQTDEGRAFVYLGSASGLAASAAWTAEGNQATAHFGVSVAGAGDVNADSYDDVIVGADLYDNGQTDEGRAFVFLGSASGPAASAVWTSESNQASAHHGAAVAPAGDVNGDGYADVIVGAPQYDNGTTDEGRASVYLGSAAGPAAAAAWTAESNASAAAFGSALGTAGDINGDGYADVIIGASQLDNGDRDEGRAFVYLGSATGLGLAPDWTYESDQRDAFFATSVGAAGDVNGDGFGDVIAGSPMYDNGQGEEGRSFVFLGSAEGGGVGGSAGWTIDGAQSFERLGFNVAAAGDVNGDGFADVVVSATGYDNGQTDEGAVFAYYGSANGLPATPSWSAEGNQANAQFGYSAGSAGDVNGDGYSDLIVGAYLYDNGQTDEGAAFLYLGSASGLAATPSWTTEGNQAGAQYGSSVAGAGDVNGDGYADVIVGAFSYSNGQSDEGGAFLYFGSPSGPSTIPDWKAEGDQVDAGFGAPVASAGDVNRDGYSDLIIGAWLYDNGEENEGRAYLYLGSLTGPSQTPAWVKESNQADALFGFPCTGVGDVNGDGYSDVVVGATAWDNGETDEGAAFLYLGTPSGLAANPSWVGEGNQNSSGYGYVRSGAGDVNGDGYSDVIVGEPYYDNVEIDEGAEFLYLGSATGLATSPAWSIESNLTNSLLGYGSGGAGDVNGDGFADVLVGDYKDDTLSTDGGRGLLYYGGGGPASLRLPRQARADDTAPIDLLGNTESLSSFRIKARGRSAAGRTKIRMAMEVKPLAAPLDGTGLVRTPAADTGAPSGSGSSIAYNQLLATLSPEVAYRWRVRFESGSVFFPRTQWFTPAGNARTETDLRTQGCLDADADGYGSPGQPYCPSGGGTDCNDSVRAINPGAPEVCNNIDDNCDGTIDSFTTFCGVGACARTGVCTAGSNSCAPGAPSPETCDNVDNNCDGTVDMFPTTCGVGACVRSGTCIAGSNVCTPGPPTQEVCDNIDNNCDGTVDAYTTTCGVGACQRNGFCSAGSNSCVPGAPSAEVCDNVDNNCDGTVDGFQTSCGVGGCARTGTCTGGVNNCQPGAPTAEVCDNIDNNCDGTVDSMATTCGLGPCTRTGFCSAGSNSCVPGTPSPEVCDNIDNNCDGTIDGYTTTCGIGGCVRHGTCTAGADNCAPGPPVPETCNLIDDDCDGSVDQGVQNTYYRDADADTYGNPLSTTLACTVPSGYSVAPTDCNDSVPAIWAKPGEAQALLVTHNRSSGVTTIAWSPPAAPGATSAGLRYDTMKSPVAAGFGAAATCLETNGSNTNSTDSTAPAAGSAFFYLVRARDWCPDGLGTLGSDSNGAETTAPPCSTACTFNGTVSITPVSSPPNLDQGPRNVVVSASGADTFVSARLMIVKTGGAVDYDSIVVTTGTSWNFSWTPSQGVGTYVATATVSSSVGCSGTANNTWSVIVPACTSCAAIVAADPNPTGGTFRYYRQQNQINNTCTYPLGITAVAIRARSTCATCATPLNLLKVQYLPTGTFADETSNVVYTAAGSGDPVSTSQTASMNFSGSPLSVPASSTTAKVRFIFSTSTPIWVGTTGTQKSVLEGDFTFAHTGGWCTTSTIVGQKLEVTP